MTKVMTVKNEEVPDYSIALGIVSCNEDKKCNHRCAEHHRHYDNYPHNHHLGLQEID